MKAKSILFVIALTVLSLSVSFSQDLFGLKNLYPKIAETKLSPEEREMRKLEIEAKALRLKAEIRERKASEQRILDSIAIADLRNDSIVVEYERIDNLYEANKDYWNESSLQTGKAIFLFTPPVIESKQSMLTSKESMNCVPASGRSGIFFTTETQGFSIGVDVLGVMHPEKERPKDVKSRILTLGARYGLFSFRDFNIWIGGGVRKTGLEETVYWSTRNEVFLEVSCSFFDLFRLGKDFEDFKLFAHTFFLSFKKTRTGNFIGAEAGCSILNASYQYDVENKVPYIGFSVRIPFYSLVDIK